MSLRVIAGSLKGRRLMSPTWPGLRPTSDRLRETLFNILGPRIAGRRVLDGYAGTGALGIEALSRGAAHVTFVEHDPRAARLVADNLAVCGVWTAEGRRPGPRPTKQGTAPDERCSIIRTDFVIAAERGIPAGPFDLVLLDPPYDEPALDRVLEAAERVVAIDGLVVLEHAARRAAPPESRGLRLTRTVTAGDSVLSFYGTKPSLEET